MQIEIYYEENQSNLQVNVQEGYWVYKDIRVTSLVIISILMRFFQPMIEVLLGKKKDLRVDWVEFIINLEEFFIKDIVG